MLNFSGERIVPEADNCEPLFALKMYQEHIARYLFASQAAQGKSVLDVGCGVGYGSQLLARRGASSVTSFDLSDEAIAHAREFYPHPNVRYLVASAESFSFAESFDLITCFELIEHIPRQHEAIKHIAGALKSDGILVISTPRPTGKHRSAFHARELSFLDFSNLLSCYFPHIEWFFENDHFGSLVAGSTPQSIHAVHTLHPQFDLGQADYFVAVASRSPINRELFQDQLVMNNDAYVKNLEHDVEILHRAEDDLKNQRDDLKNQIEVLTSQVGSLRQNQEQLVNSLQAAKSLVEEVQARAAAELQRERDELAQLKTQCTLFQQETDKWRASSVQAEASVRSLEGQINAICTSRSWKVTRPLRSLALNIRRNRASNALAIPAAAPATEEAGNSAAPSSQAPNKRRQFDVLYVIGCHEGESKRYRVHNLCNALTRLGYSAGYVADNEIPDVIERGYLARVVVLFRCAHSDTIKRLLKYCKSQGIVTIFDIDDLVFEPESIGYVHVVNTFGPEDRAAYARDVNRYRQALLECDRATCTTSYLAQRIANLGKPVDVIPNSLNDSQLAIARSIDIESHPHPSELRIGYFSGSNTHQVDFRACEAALLHILRRYPQVRFVLVGILDLGPQWDQFSDRVERHPMVSSDKMLRLLATTHVNLAPLEMGSPYCEGKSQLKIFEAGLVAVPTVASATQSYKEAIDDGLDGFLASTTDEWIAALEQLIASDEVRLAMGAEAKRRALTQFGPETVAWQAAQVYRFPMDVHSGKRERREDYLKITWIVPGLIIGGGGHRNILRAAYHLEQFGHDVELYFTSTEMDSYELKQTVRSHFYPLQSPMHRYKGDISPTDVLFATHWSTVDAAVKARPSVRELMYFVQDFEPAFAPMGTEYILAENTYRLGLYHITSGPWCEKFLKEQFGAEADHFVFPVDRSVYYPRTRSALQPRVLFFAKPEMPRRCFELGVMALEQFHALRPDVEIVLFGSKHLENRALSFPATIESVLPTLDDLAQLYSNADVGIVFSTTNPSLVPYEMMACGLPVMDLGRPGNEVNYGGRTDIAFLADPAPEIMARQLSALLDDKDDLANRSKRGFEFVGGFPSEEEMARRVEELILRRVSARSRTRQTSGVFR